MSEQTVPFSPIALVGTISLLAAYVLGAWCIAAGIAGNARRSRRLTSSSVYGLHGFSAFMGLVSSVAVVTAFLTGWPSIIAVALNYATRHDVRGTFLESHYRWQIRTFWWGLLWAVVGGITALVFVGFIILAADAIWIIYRIAKGWLYLSENRPLA